MELSTADPVPTSVRFYLAALLSNSAGREICRCFIFFFFSPHKQMHQAKPSQAADGRQCQMHEKKNVLFRPKLCIWERRVFQQSVGTKWLFCIFWQNSPSSLFCLHSGTESPEEPLGTEKKLFRFMTFCTIEIHKHTC